MIEYVVITLGRSGLMARFDDAGRLVEWTPYIKSASIFLTAEAGAAAIRGICRPEIDAAVRTGRAVREFDEETGEVVVMDYSGRRARPMPTRSLGRDFDRAKLEAQLARPRPKPVDVAARSRSIGLDQAEPAGHVSPRRLARETFRDARRNPTRQTEALISPSSTNGDDYTTPASRRGRLAHMARSYAAG